MRRNRIIYRIALDSMMAALYFIMTYLSIRIGTDYHITTASMMVILSSQLFGLPDALFISLLGEFLNQTLTYGIMITTPLWLIPPLARALVLSLFKRYYAKRNDSLRNHIVIYFLAIVLAGLSTSLLNTAVTFLDGYIIGYPVSFVLLKTTIRFLLNILTSIILGTISLPILKVLSKAIQKDEGEQI